MEVQSTLAADDSTYRRNDVEQLRGSVQIEHSGSHGRPSNEHLMWPLASQMLAPGPRSGSHREAWTKMKPTVLVVTTDRWVPTARLAMALTNAGCTVEAVCPPRH